MTAFDNDATAHPARQARVVRVADNDFQREVLAKLVRPQSKLDMLFGGYQPGRMKLAEDRIQDLMRNDIKRSVYDRFLNAVIAIAVRLAIAMRDKFK
jgi:hypothetical protein